MNVLISVSYNGTKFDGYQIQIGLRTVQGEIEGVLGMIFNRYIKTYASGRTDAGTHALNQYINFFIDDFDLNLLLYKMNKMLPNDIHVNTIRKVPETFNARLSAIEKTYKYVLEIGDRNPFREDLIYSCFDKLDTKLLFEAADFFKGQHSFRNFTSKLEDQRDFVRNIYDIKFDIYGNVIEITFVGSGFMKYEVRMLVGNMIAYAAGKITKEDIISSLESKERNITSYCAPACGLYLVDVKYNLSKGLDYCYHIHTYRCGHAVGSDEEYVLAAIETGFKYIGFSDHVFLKGIYHPSMRGNYEELENYISSIASLKEKYKDKIDIKIGFEAEYLPQFVDQYKELLSSKTIDYLLLGQHCIYENGNPIWYTDKENDFEDRERYVNDLVDGMKSGLFTYVCHPDLFFQGITIDDEIIDSLSERICEASLKYDIPLEINLGGLRHYAKGVHKLSDLGFIPYPNERFWKIVGSYQCKVVIGVDAHNPIDFKRSQYELAFEFIDKYGLNYIDDFRINK